jgi:hypothetical protein
MFSEQCLAFLIYFKALGVHSDLTVDATLILKCIFEKNMLENVDRINLFQDIRIGLV